MVLAMNIGNTNFAMGFRENNDVNVYTYPIRWSEHQSNFVQIILQLIMQKGIKPENVNGAIISSVNPNLTDFLIDATKILFGFSPLVVNSNMNMKLNLSNYDTELLGNDRIAVCEAAISQYSAPIIIFDFGTATTINVVDSAHDFLGGSILPGLAMGFVALSANTAQLPDYDLSKLPRQVKLIGQDTQECLTSGAIFCNAAMLDAMVQRIEVTLNNKATVLITGGNACLIYPICETKVIYEPNLLISGLYFLYEKNF